MAACLIAVPKRAADPPNEGAPDETRLWDTMADELVEYIGTFLVPGVHESPWLSRPLSEVASYIADRSVGAAHWCQLSKALHRRSSRDRQWLETLRRNRRSHHENAACCRVLGCHDESIYDCAPPHRLQPAPSLRARLCRPRPVAAARRAAAGAPSPGVVDARARPGRGPAVARDAHLPPHAATRLHRRRQGGAPYCQLLPVTVSYSTRCASPTPPSPRRCAPTALYCQ